MNLRQRIDRLAARVGAEDSRLLVALVDIETGEVTVNGETMSREQMRARWADSGVTIVELKEE